MNPLGTGSRDPLLSWVVRSSGTGERQASREVEVARDADFTDLLWASGPQPGQEPNLRYGGAPLPSRTRAWWRVRVQGAAGETSLWSEPATFETGLLDPGEWSASWITHPDWAGDTDADALPLLAGEFRSGGPVAAARLYVAGLGICVPSLNGAKVTAAVLEPPYSDFARTIDYSTYDVTALLQDGPNVLGLRLGTGIAHVTAPPDRYTKFAATIARPRALAQLEILGEDGSIQRFVSDGTWRTALGPTRRSHWYGGEDYDARLVVADWDRPRGNRSDWAAAAVVPWEVELAARAAPPIQVVETITPVAMTNPAPGICVVDLGVNIAGWPLLDLTADAGHEIRIVPGEVLDGDGRVAQQEIGTPVESVYTTTAGQQSWHPEFMYHGFRFLELHGLPAGSGPEVCSGLVLRAGNESTGRFSCSNEVLDATHRIIDRAVQGNMFSVLTDCPHREKLGWLEETHLLFGVVSNGYDVQAYYRDLVRRMAEAQLDSGMVPDISPEFVVFDGGFRDDPNWGGAIVLAPWQLYRTYGDVATLRTYYPAMQRYLAYLQGKADGDLLDHGLGDWYSLEEKPPRAAVATWGYGQVAAAMAGIADVLGESGDADDHRKLLLRIRAAFHERFFDGADGYGRGQAINALALDLDAVPDELRTAVTARLAETISAAGDHLMVGEVSLPAVLRALSSGGHDELIYRVAARTDWPSYGYQFVHGATALTEAWDGPTTGASQNHFMLGAIDDWFVRRLAGIDQAADSVGYRHAVIRPAVVGDLTEASASIGTPYGPLASAWTRDDSSLRLEVDVPVGSTALVQVPLPDPSWSVEAAPESTVTKDGFHQIGSGHWSFRAAPSRSAR
ncbi:family 78 glycoside hydrolase catalytic domain [Kribbella italica]|uniref:alpha-L-rhamnosidase n=1 Tax=Kribbella italica TaxID=1540520 RepID=A0A7W9J5B6_9ACTN|nr:alpha-L-rhamnosidase [Kribbella italica]